MYIDELNDSGLLSRVRSGVRRIPRLSWSGAMHRYADRPHRLHGEKRAAVAIVLKVCNGAPSILLTKRAEHLRNHPGEVCVPGGRIDAGDASPLAAACRELHEEVGISQSDILGYRHMSKRSTSSGYRIWPFVMLIAEASRLVIDSAEVSTHEYVPVSELLMLERYRITHFSPGRDAFSYSLPTSLGEVRGATCGMLLELVADIARIGGVEPFVRSMRPLPCGRTTLRAGLRWMTFQVLPWREPRLL